MADFYTNTRRLFERCSGAFVLAYLSISSLTDFIVDFANGVSEAHLIAEAIVSVFGFYIVCLMVKENISIRKEVRSIKRLLDNHSSEVSKARSEAERWQNETARLLNGLATAIERKFSEWHLTPAEREIGFYLLKGLSLKEIADVRDVSERTVRQQTLTIYEKSDLAGRAELSAFFLKDLLPAAKSEQMSEI